MNRTKRIVAAILAIAMCAVLFAGCSTKPGSAKTGVEDGVLTVAMECEYAPYNWTPSANLPFSSCRLPALLLDTLLVRILYQVLS